MKLLVVTQIVDEQDSNLGFFHVWIKKLAEQVESLTVICLAKGEYDLPLNATVLSLGKEEGVSRLAYLRRFYRYIYSWRRQYDGVFVHMNPEYVILGGWLWRLWDKKILLWYTHKAVNWRLRLAEKLSTKIFTASPESFRLPSRKVEMVGHGIEVDTFADEPGIRTTAARRLLFVGRISPVKDLETVVLAISELKKKPSCPTVTLDVVGEPITAVDKSYHQTIVELVNTLGLSDIIHFRGGVPHPDVIDYYKTSTALIHTSQTGSLDKVVLEALAAGLTVFTSSEAYASFGDLVVRFSAHDPQKLAQSIEKNLLSDMMVRTRERQQFVREHHDLNTVIERIIGYFSG